MLSLTTRKVSGFGFSFALAALLLNCATASAAGMSNDAHDQAASLLSHSVASLERNAIALAPASTSAPSLDAMDQARHLLSGMPALSPDGGSNATPASYSTAKIAAYANAEESARRMILGDGA